VEIQNDPLPQFLDRAKMYKHRINIWPLALR
jgi:hypothetical protein